MKFFETSKYFTLKKSTYINLRWFAIIGQFITINLVYLILNFKFDFILANFVIFIGILSNLYLVYINQKTQLSDKSAFLFLLIDISPISRTASCNERSAVCKRPSIDLSNLAGFL